MTNWASTKDLQKINLKNLANAQTLQKMNNMRALENYKNSNLTKWASTKALQKQMFNNWVTKKKYELVGHHKHYKKRTNTQAFQNSNRTNWASTLA